MVAGGWQWGIPCAHYSEILFKYLSFVWFFLDIIRCNYYVFPGVDEYPNVRGTTGYYYDVNTNQQIKIRQFVDEYIRDQLDVIDLAHLDEEQVSLSADLINNLTDQSISRKTFMTGIHNS